MQYDVWTQTPSEAAPHTVASDAKEAVRLLQEAQVEALPGAAGPACFTPHGQMEPLLHSVGEAKEWEDAALCEVMQWCATQILPIIDEVGAEAALDQLNPEQMYLIERYEALTAAFQDASQSMRFDEIRRQAGLVRSAASALEGLVVVKRMREDPEGVLASIRSYFHLDDAPDTED